MQALIAESPAARNGQRYLCSAANDSGLLNIFQLQVRAPYENHQPTTQL